MENQGGKWEGYFFVTLHHLLCVNDHHDIGAMVFLVKPYTPFGETRCSLMKSHVRTRGNTADDMRMWQIEC